MSQDADDTSIKIISPTTHGVIDYAFVALLFAAPSVLGFTGAFAYACYALGVVHLLLTITTRFAAGLYGVLSFRTHGLIELLVAIGLVISPWIFNFADLAVERNFFFGFGLLVFVVWMLTLYRQPKAKESEVEKEDSATTPASKPDDDASDQESQQQDDSTQQGESTQDNHER